MKGNGENLYLKSEIAYLKGKIETYERFLRSQGFIKEKEVKNDNPNKQWKVNHTCLHTTSSNN